MVAKAELFIDDLCGTIDHKTLIDPSCTDDLVWQLHHPVLSMLGYPVT